MCLVGWLYFRLSLALTELGSWSFSIAPDFDRICLQSPEVTLQGVLLMSFNIRKRFTSPGIRGRRVSALVQLSCVAVMEHQQEKDLLSLRYYVFLGRRATGRASSLCRE
jgi:hypothetical protein